jgi:hypothetical protein
VPEPLTFTTEAIRGRLDGAEDRELALIARDSGIVDLSLLLQQLSMHLPRFAPDEAVSPHIVLAEARRLASRLSRLQSPYLNRLPTVPEATSSTDLVFSTISEDIACTIHRAFHYLLSFREKSCHFGLSSVSGSRWPVAMCSLAPFDLLNMEAALANQGFSPETAAVIARVYAFPGAPRNSITFLFGKTRRWLRDHRPMTRVLLTYLNPNVGFTGLSYRADNWSLLGHERTHYSYFEGDYITERDLARRSLRSDSRVALSQCELQPLRVLIRPVTRPDSSTERAVYFAPWSPDRK